MKPYIYCLIILFFLFTEFISAQTNLFKIDSVPFNTSYWNGVADKKQLAGEERKEFISAHKRTAGEEPQPSIQQKYDIQVYNFSSTNSKGKSQNNTTLAGPCTNIDFEAGNMSGWTRSSGFHPGYNATGCCPNTNGQQVIMTGTGVDPYGGFPVVFPGGSFSVRLGNNGVNGQADRLEQTFFVSSSNANFTYRYAV